MSLCPLYHGLARFPGALRGCFPPPVGRLSLGSTGMVLIGARGLLVSFGIDGVWLARRGGYP